MVIEKLIAGFKSFKGSYYTGQSELYSSLVENGQSPDALVIACSDSRVDPAIITKAEPGQLFVVRNVANLVAPYQSDNPNTGTSAAIEFAVRDLKVSHIIILGHTHCGGINRLCNRTGEKEPREFIDSWMSIVENDITFDLQGEELLRNVEKQVIKISLDNVLSFPWVKSRVDSGMLEIHGWLFDLEAGEIKSYSKNSGWQSISQ
jgi:carbonic anhydrase